MSRSWSEVLRELGYVSAGGNDLTVKKYVAKWRIDTAHFTPSAAPEEALRRYAAGLVVPLDEVAVVNSTYPRASLKRRLYAEGIKRPVCECCGQGEVWTGKRMAMILDHINGVPNDHRLHNLRILCPNCAATLDTHCGAKNRRRRKLNCVVCGAEFQPKKRNQRCCSRECGQSLGAEAGASLRRVIRPPYEQLVAEIQETSYEAVGRRYGFSGNAIRKWVRFYERERQRADESGDGG
ncbi:hypothetical protein BH10ACT11_BH10ACT11_08080 [soil metagenome]